MFTNQPARRLTSKKPSTQIIPYQGENGTADPKKIEAIEKVMQRNQSDEGAVSGKGA
jgi:hypothetical protein